MTPESIGKTVDSRQPGAMDPSFDLVRPADLRQVLQHHGIHLTRGLGQHFLVNRHALERIVETARIQPNQPVLEIGPGSGVLTRALAAAGAQVVAIEKDRAMLPVLEQTVGHLASVRIVHGDALKVDWPALLPPGVAAKVVANIPYNITAPLLTKMCLQTPRFESMTLLVQKEVAMRLAAAPGSPDYGSLTLFVGYHASVKRVVDVSPESFLPPPRVVSSVIHLQALEQPPVPVAADDFLRVTRAAFGQRRKTLRNSLSAGLEMAPATVAGLLERCGIDPEARAESLGMLDFGRIAAEVRDHSDAV
jgi:16S rRNA (adenine1518-N6/adenine1519-N6)-dimethyltransferase